MSNNELTPIALICAELASTITRKNHDYDNAFDKSLDEWGLSIAGARIGDKYNRIKALIKGHQPQVSDESLRDSLMDMAGYCVLTINYLDHAQQGRKD